MVNKTQHMRRNTEQFESTKNGGQFRYDMLHRKTNILKHILITAEFIFAISHNFKYCHCLYTKGHLYRAKNIYFWHSHTYGLRS